MSVGGAGSVLFWLIVGHAFADYIVQSAAISADKNRRKAAAGMWLYAMSAHCLVNAGAVAAATGSVPLGCAEFVAHFAIDVLRCERGLSRAADQGLHIVCKLLWLAIVCR